MKDDNLLLNAINENNYNIVKFLLDNGEKIDMRDSLTIIKNCKNDKILDLLLESGIDLSYNENNNIPIIHYYKYNEDMIKILLKYNIELNKFDTNGYTELAEQQDIKIVKLLIDNGSDLNIINKYGRTQLSYQNSYDIVKFMLDNGANPVLGIKYASKYYDNDIKIKKLLEQYERKIMENIYLTNININSNDAVNYAVKNIVYNMITAEKPEHGKYGRIILEKNETSSIVFFHINKEHYLKINIRLNRRLIKTMATYIILEPIMYNDFNLLRKIDEFTMKIYLNDNMQVNKIKYTNIYHNLTYNDICKPLIEYIDNRRSTIYDIIINSNELIKNIDSINITRIIGQSINIIKKNIEDMRILLTNNNYL